MALTLYDAARCPYCARVRIALAEKGIDYETVVIDLSDGPDRLYEKNPKGKVPVLEEGSFVLPESEVINEYLDERFPEPALLNGSQEERGLARVRVQRFEDDFGDHYYGFRRGGPFERRGVARTGPGRPAAPRWRRARPSSRSRR